MVSLSRFWSLRCDFGESCFLAQRRACSSAHFPFFSYILKRPNENKDRESRIIDEIVVDAYGEQERAMGWYYYAADKITFPFKVCWATKRAISTLINIGNHPPSSGYVLLMLGIPRRQQSLLAEYPHHQATNHNSSPNTRFPRPVRSDAG